MHKGKYTMQIKLCINMFKICINMQEYAVNPQVCLLCIYMYFYGKKYAKICKICKHESHMQNMQKYAFPTLLMKAS